MNDLDADHSAPAHEIAAPASSSQYAVGLRLAWWGRVSTEDQQDPTLSLPRQLHNSRGPYPPVG